MSQYGNKIINTRHPHVAGPPVIHTKKQLHNDPNARMGEQS